MLSNPLHWNSEKRQKNHWTWSGVCVCVCFWKLLPHLLSSHLDWRLHAPVSDLTHLQTCLHSSLPLLPLCFGILSYRTFSIDKSHTIVINYRSLEAASLLGLVSSSGLDTLSLQLGINAFLHSFYFIFLESGTALFPLSFYSVVYLMSENIILFLYSPHYNVGGKSPELLRMLVFSLVLLSSFCQNQSSHTVCFLYTGYSWCFKCIMILSKHGNVSCPVFRTFQPLAAQTLYSFKQPIKTHLDLLNQAWLLLVVCMTLFSRIT